MLDYEIVIVGAGPAGSSTAIQLANLNPKLAYRVLLLDKAIFPRPKLCAGGVTNRADFILAQLGVRIETPSVPTHISKFILPTGTLTLWQERHFRVFNREEFDYELFRAAERLGIRTQTGEALEQLTLSSDGVIIRTSKREYRAKIVIGADGANSIVRRLLGLQRTSRVMMAMEIHAPMSKVNIHGFRENIAIFDFATVSKDLPGYCWIFPTINKNALMLSLGIIESSFNKNKRISLKSAFTRWLAEVAPDWNEFNLKAHPALRYEPRAQCSQYRALLVGDAVGLDPLFGEGITSALALGKLAAESANDALRSNDFSFSDYEMRIRSSFIGNMMRRRRTVARRRYADYQLRQRQVSFSNLLDWVTPISPREVPATVTWEPSSSYSVSN